MNILLQTRVIFDDSLALKTFIVAVTICLLTCIYRFTLGLYFILLFIISLTLIVFAIQSSSIRKQFQEIIETLLKSKYADTGIKSSTDGSKILLARGLDERLERLLTRLLDQFIRSWWSSVSQDETFIYTLKLELTRAIRRLAVRYRHLDYPTMITTKLLPIVYAHFAQIEHSIKANHSSEQLIKSFLEARSPHPAVTSRKSELQYLRALSENLMPYLFSMSNFKCRVAYDIVRELLTNWILLQITDIISEPCTINLLVILATNQNTTPIRELSDRTEVELLANFVKTNETTVSGSNQQVDGHFFNDQEKLYNFMQHLKSQHCGDVDILKFLLDVEHMNAQLEKSSVISDPTKLSNLQQTSEKLLTLYRDSLFRGESKDMPGDLIECYNHAKQYLEYKWKFDFYKSADYYKYIYGDREIYNTCKQQERDEMYSDVPPLSNQKLTAKIKNAMSMKIAVDGIEDDIQVYDAMDIASNSPFHYYNSMAVKLRKERGQDLDNFMQTFYHSIEQEADMGEDIVETQTKSERQQHSRIKYGNIELFQNLFNTAPGTANASQFTVTTAIKSPLQSLLYFLAKIVNLHEVLLRIITGICNFLPDSSKLVCMAIRRIAEKLVNQAILAHLVNELEEKLFDSKLQHHQSREEQAARRSLAIERLDKLKSGLSSNLLLLQNAILNKHLIYSLLDVLIMEGFDELNPNLMPK